jgi:predicted Fe-S protein YdhL (DUF1289 family)
MEKMISFVGLEKKRKRRIDQRPQFGLGHFFGNTMLLLAIAAGTGSVADCFVFSPCIRRGSLPDGKSTASFVKRNTYLTGSSGHDLDNDKQANATTTSPSSRQNPIMENESESLPATPCVRICRYNADFFDGAVCIGCFREAYEIQTWASSSTPERIFTLEDAMDRQEEMDDSTVNFPGSISRQELSRHVDFYKRQQEKKQ